MHTKTDLPECVGFIMDGNRRWAKQNGFDTLEGHRKGHEVFEKLIPTIRDLHLAHAVFYAFSTENWNRSEREVIYLMNLFKKVLSSLLESAKEDSVRVRVIGERKRFTAEIQKLIEKVEEESSAYTVTTIWVALSYGGRTEIVDAVNRAIEIGEPVNEESFSKLLWTNEMPDPNLIIRTSGENRLSNFLPWQSVYSELFFTKTLWPDFGPEEFKSILEAYANRQQRRGK